MIPGSLSTAVATGFQGLAPFLNAYQPKTLVEARQRVAKFEREELLTRFQKAFVDNRRPTAFLIADELIARNIPPSCWRSYQSTAARDFDVNRRFDLMLYDLRWLRSWYPNQPRIIRCKRYCDLFTPSEPAFHRAAEFVFYAGKRPIWKIVGSLSMTAAQQWQCSLLRSVPINKKQVAVDAMREKVFNALGAGLATAGRTACFTDQDATATLVRRHAIWLCSKMGDSKSPTEIAARYEQLTGRALTRQIVARQLEIVRKVLAENDLTA